MPSGSAGGSALLPLYDEGHIHEGVTRKAERRRASLLRAGAEERKRLEAVARAGEAAAPRRDGVMDGARREREGGRAGLVGRRHARVSAARCRSGSGVDEEMGGTPGYARLRPAPRRRHAAGADARERAGWGCDAAPPRVAQAAA
jgi:hypothetical protein